jgi:dTDP-4-amino-4,6-dideoxygalactose transaminase
MNPMTNGFIPFHVPTIGEEEIQEVVDVLRSGWLTTGSRVIQFEKDFAAYSGARHALAVNSCTAGLHLALAGLRIGPGDEVITTPLTFCATVNTILHVGATPVLADVDEHGNIDPASIAERITPRTRAIVPVHLAGRVVNLDAIWALARQHNLYVIEDAAHAAGSLHHGLPLGTSQPGNCSDAVAFSFYATKNITTGEGGMVTTNNPELAARIKMLTLHGISKDAWARYTEKGNWFYQVMEPGFKCNLTDVAAAVGLHQLKKIDQFAADRRALAAFYSEAFRGVGEIETPSLADTDSNSWHLYMLRLRLDHLSIDRAGFMSQLRDAGIGASVHFIPIPLHPFFAEYAGLPQNQVPRALAMYPRLISLPLYTALGTHNAQRVVDAVKSICHKARPVFAGASMGAEA